MLIIPRKGYISKALTIRQWDIDVTRKENEIRTKNFYYILKTFWKLEKLNFTIQLVSRTVLVQSSILVSYDLKYSTGLSNGNSSRYTLLF